MNQLKWVNCDTTSTDLPAVEIFKRYVTSCFIVNLGELATELQNKINVIEGYTIQKYPFMSMTYCKRTARKRARDSDDGWGTC